MRRAAEAISHDAPYTTGTATPSRASTSSGAGPLAVVREIAGGHGGTIEAESAPDGGTVMRLTLPLAQQ